MNVAVLNSRLRAGFLALAPLLIPGCGSSHEASVHGTVSMDGKPLANVNGEVQFHSLGDAGTAYGRLDPSGNYVLQTGDETGLAPGEYKVTVVGRAPFPENLPAGDTPPIPQLLTPERYGNLDTTPLRYTVVAGDNAFELSLTSKQ